LNVLREACAPAVPAGASAVSLSSVSVNGERFRVDGGPENKSLAVAGRSTGIAAAGEVASGPSDVVLLAGWDGDASFDEGSSPLAKRVPPQGLPTRHTISAAVVGTR
jgi:hypothetical protein